MRSTRSHVLAADDTKTKILDPHGTFIKKWNKILLVSCLIAASVDPLFFYIPVIDSKKNCLSMDPPVAVIACGLRFLVDIFYIIHIILRFRTGFVSPSAFGRGVVVKDHHKIAKNYLCSNFLIDVLAIIPLPQIIIWLPLVSRTSVSHLTPNPKNFLICAVVLQFIPRILRVRALYKQATRTSGIFTEKSWTGAAFNLFLILLASHMVGASWYLLSIQRQVTCWLKNCNGCGEISLLCPRLNNTKQSLNCPVQTPNATAFDFGIFLDALQSGVVESENVGWKIFYCFWWGLQHLSSLGQNLKTSTSSWEIGFALSVCMAGLVLFSLLIGNMQTYLQSSSRRLEDMRMKRVDMEQWMSHRLLPEDLKKRIRRYEEYKWQENGGIDEESLIRKLSKDLRRDVTRHLFLDLLKKVPLFEKMDAKILDAMCDRVKPTLYAEDSYIVREGDIVDELFFIMRGCGKASMTTSNLFNMDLLKEGDMCGEELLNWALDTHSSSNLPVSTRSVQALSEVEAFSLTADDLKLIASQLRRLHGEQLHHMYRFYSAQWRVWAACIIQAEWRRHRKKKSEQSLRQEESRSPYK